MNGLKSWMVGCCILSLATAGVLAQEAAPPAPAAPAAPAAVPVDPTAILKAIPADATAFVVLRSLQELDGDLAGIVQQLGLPPGIVPGPVDLLRMRLGLSRGLNPGGSLGIVVLNLADVKEPDAIVQKVVILLPATSGDEMLESLGATKEGELSRVNLMGQDSVAATREGFVVVGQTADAVKAVLGARGEGVLATMSPDRAKAYAGQDLFAWANPRGVSKELKDQVQAGLSQLTNMGQPAPSEANPGVDQLSQIIDQAQEFALSASLDQHRGLTFGWYARMREGTDLAKQTAAMKGSDKSLLIGLPNEPMVLAFGSVGAGSSPAAQTQMQQMWDKVFALYTQMLADKVDAEKFGQLKEPIFKLLTSIEAMSAGISGLAPEDADGLVAARFVARVKNSAEWKAEARKVFAQLKELITEVSVKEGAPPEKVKVIADAIQWKENAEQVAGASVDHFIVDLEKMPEFSEGTPNTDTIREIKSVIGKDGILIRVAAIGDNHVAITFGGGGKALTPIAANVQKSEAPLGTNRDIQKVAGRLPEGPRVMEGYLSLAHLLTLVSNIATELQQPLPIPLLRDATPIAVASVKVGDNAQYTEVLVPMEVVSSVKEAIAPFLMMMMGGGMNEEAPQEPAPAPGGELN